jgi:hypothetical protein
LPSEEVAEGSVESEADVLVCDGERTGAKRIAQGMHNGQIDARLRVSGSGFRSGCKFVNKNLLDRG